MNPLGFFKKREALIAIDIGSGAIKLAEIEGSPQQPQLVSFALRAFGQEVISNNIVSKPEQVAEVISSLLDANQIEGKRAAVSIPAPAVFTKRIKMPKQGEDELRDSVQFEAGNFIPHKLDAVKLDFAVLGESGKNQLDVLVVAVKRELLESLEDCLGLAGLETALADVDFFALHNVYETNYPELKADTSAVLSVGYRYTSVSISKEGLPVFVGDVAIGLKQLEEELALKLNIPDAQCRAAVQNLVFEPAWQETVNAFIDTSSQELSRQLSFFWNTCGIEGNINRILLSGGAAVVPGFSDALGRKAGMTCELLNPFAKITLADSIDTAYLNKVAPLLAVATGLGLRAPGDVSAG